MGLGDVVLGAADCVATPANRSIPPLHRLPAELLCFVFLLVLDGDAERNECELEALQRVCRDWRTLAQAPRLWADISVISGESRGIGLRRLHERLRRSKAVPLHVVMESPDVEELSVDEDESAEAAPVRLNDADEAIFREAAHSLRPHLYRTRSLSVVLKSDAAVQATFPLRSALPSLERLHMTLHDTVSSETSSKLTLFGPDRKCAIDELVINADHIDAVVLGSVLPDRLRSLRITVRSHLGTHCMRLLSQAERLESLKISDCEGAIKSKQLFNLHTPLLHEAELPGHHLMDYISFWNAPQLTHLTVIPQLNEVYFPKPITFPSLRTLTITSRQRHTPDPNFAQILQWIPSLVGIDIPSYLRFATRILDTLVAKEICPHLRFMRLRAYHSDFGSAAPALRNFLQSREDVFVHLHVLSSKQNSARAFQLEEAYATRVTVSTNAPPLATMLDILV